MNIPLPFFVVKWIVRRNPWILVENGKVRRSIALDIIFWKITLDSGMSLLPKIKERLLDEMKGPHK